MGTTAAGISIVLLAAGAALLPAEKGLSADVLGALMLAAGLVETVAGALRRDTRLFAMLAGGVTALAGLFYLVNDARFFPSINIFIAWLVVHGILLAVVGMQLSGTVRRWTFIAGATDFLLGLILLVGVSLASAVVLIFGPTPAMVASFAWVLAISFVVTGIMLLQIAGCERSAIAAER